MSQAFEIALIGLVQDYHLGRLDVDFCSPVANRSQASIERSFIIAILSSGWNYDRAINAYHHLLCRGYLEDSLASEQHVPLEQGLRHPNVRHRFPNVKATQVWKTISKLRLLSEQEKHIFETFADGSSLREFFVKEFSGVGMKQASMIIRDLGYFSNLAVIDAHIVWYLKNLQTETPSLNANNYLKLEKKLTSMACCYGLTISELDALIWVGVRRFKQSAGKKKCSAQFA